MKYRSVTDARGGGGGGEGWRVNIMEGGPDVRAQSAISWDRARRCGPGVYCVDTSETSERDQSVLKVSDQ